MAPAVSGGTRTTDRFPCSLAPWAGSRGLVSLLLAWGEGRAEPRAQQAGSFKWSAHPSGGVACRAHAQYLALVLNPLFLSLGLQKWQLSFLVSYYLLSRNCPNCACMQLLLVPYSCLIICCSRRGISLQQRFPGSILSQY